MIDRDALPRPRASVEVDLDGDGRPETAAVYALDDAHDVVTVRGDGLLAAFATPINLSDSPSLERMGNGNLRVSWGCFACGRTHATVSVVIDLRDGALRVIGWDWSLLDRIHAAALTCSANLLTGAVIVEAVGVDRQDLSTGERDRPVATLAEQRAPDACTEGLARYDDAYLARHFPPDR
ncbi:hypothetical protein JQC91_02205 [Jannaschia sp. Os4]|uniref:hypothetical protein n=1 Tax=Jannaschia sp. Os4 TaxID=2807617 RepID=UPI001939783D|nr:hypothetical protein [Jannaschia sp. Os4]MBM2575106.1 hypothetical protein [Jannaschia sp. Os4]